VLAAELTDTMSNALKAAFRTFSVLKAAFKAGEFGRSAP
jgi:hypothetical protein